LGALTYLFDRFVVGFVYLFKNSRKKEIKETHANGKTVTTNGQKKNEVKKEK